MYVILIVLLALLGRNREASYLKVYIQMLSSNLSVTFSEAQTPPNRLQYVSGVAVPGAIL
jgi:hypothetical protein